MRNTANDNSRNMKQTSSKSFALRSIILALLHFAAVWLVGFCLFSRYGLSHPPIRYLCESAFGAGVVYLGFPDTVLGWFCNSALYGVAAAAIIHFCRRSTNDSPTIPNDRDA